MYWCDDADLAEDVVSETFLIAWRDRAAVPEPPVPYLLGVARRVLAGQRRATARRAALAARIADGLDGDGPGPAGDFESLELREALSRLPDHDREALILVGWCELSNVEAAQVLGCSQVAFAVRLHRARRRLRAELGNGGDLERRDQRDQREGGGRSGLEGSGPTVQAEAS